jgi:hypothetical protein
MRGPEAWDAGNCIRHRLIGTRVAEFMSTVDYISDCAGWSLGYRSKQADGAPCAWPEGLLDFFDKEAELQVPRHGASRVRRELDGYPK